MSGSGRLMSLQYTILVLPGWNRSRMRQARIPPVFGSCSEARRLRRTGRTGRQADAASPRDQTRSAGTDWPGSATRCRFAACPCGASEVAPPCFASALSANAPRRAGSRVPDSACAEPPSGGRAIAPWQTPAACGRLCRPFMPSRSFAEIRGHSIACHAARRGSADSGKPAKSLPHSDAFGASLR
jgi:hypothetical protein